MEDKSQNKSEQLWNEMGIKIDKYRFVFIALVFSTIALCINSYEHGIFNSIEPLLYLKIVEISGILILILIGTNCLTTDFNNQIDALYKNGLIESWFEKIIKPDFNFSEEKIVTAKNLLNTEHQKLLNEIGRNSFNFGRQIQFYLMAVFIIFFSRIFLDFLNLDWFISFLMGSSFIWFLQGFLLENYEICYYIEKESNFSVETLWKSLFSKSP